MFFALIKSKPCKLLPWLDNGFNKKYLKVDGHNLYGSDINQWYCILSQFDDVSTKSLLLESLIIVYSHYRASHQCEYLILFTYNM
ncbi:hypothetical protein NC652_038742 [Populus alba x Populus x berolinensis]|nr:hypothetical protein NC652_038742 [Populus alba x Populus x berolinensis]